MFATEHLIKLFCIDTLKIQPFPQNADHSYFLYSVAFLVYFMYITDENLNPTIQLLTYQTMFSPNIPLSTVNTVNHPFLSSIPSVL